MTEWLYVIVAITCLGISSGLYLTRSKRHRYYDEMLDEVCSPEYIEAFNASKA